MRPRGHVGSHPLHPLHGHRSRHVVLLLVMPHASSVRSRVPSVPSGRVTSGVGELSGGVGPPRPVRRPKGGDSGEWVTQLESSPPPATGPAPPRAPCS